MGVRVVRWWMVSCGCWPLLINQCLTSIDASRVPAENPDRVRLRQPEMPKARQHRRNAPDLMRVVAASEDAVGTRKRDGETERVRIEVHRVVIPPPQVIARRPIDVATTILERVKAAIEPFGHVGHRAAQVREDPLDVREPLPNPAEDEMRGR